MTTIYEVIEIFMQFTMPQSIYNDYENIMTTINVYLTMVVVFTFILLPLYRIGTFWKPKR